MKRFDIAAEIAKQLLTICVALIGGIAAFLDKIIVNDEQKFLLLCVFLAFLLWLSSVVVGIFHLGAITNLVEKQEKSLSSFVSIFGSPSSELGKWQQILFFIGVVLVIFAFWLDRFYF